MAHETLGSCQNLTHLHEFH